jgi:peptidoglycan/xylan/chitin deacetylase (PgdA/CDA1 family)
LNTRILMFVMALAVVVTAAAVPAAAADGDRVYQEEDHDHFGPPSSVPQDFRPENSRVDETLGDKPNLFLSFDDGNSSLTPALLDVLATYPDVGVTFFVNCKEPASGVMQRIVDDGHAIGNHTCHHPSLTGMSSSGRRSELQQLNQFVNVRVEPDISIGCYRPPFGATSDSVRADAAAIGMWEWVWSIDPYDWRLPGVGSILADLEKMRDGDIIVLHNSEGKSQTVEAIRLFLAEHHDDYLFRALPGCGVAPVPSGPFADVPSGGTFTEDIVWVKEQGIALGCNHEGTLFCPDDVVTRGQMASFLSRALHLAPAGHGYFGDDTHNAHEDSIDRLAEAGISNGCGVGIFCPDDSVSRGQMASFLVRALGLEPIAGEVFDDASGLHEPNINALAAAGITEGCNSEKAFCPDQPVTRAQMAAFLHRALG